METEVLENLLNLLQLHKNVYFDSLWLLPVVTVTVLTTTITQTQWAELEHVTVINLCLHSVWTNI